MEKTEVFESFCKLTRKVNAEVFNFALPADCVCVEKALPLGLRFEFDQKVLDFIEAAVSEKITRQKLGGK